MNVSAAPGFNVRGAAEIRVALLKLMWCNALRVA